MAQKYKFLHKPHHPYSNSQGKVRAHRYIMYLYLSIKYNRIIYLPKSYDVHHKNGNKKDNRIENLQLITHSNHLSLGKTKDKSGRFCNICKSKTTRKSFLNGKYYDDWFYDIDGCLCFDCYGMIKKYQKRFNS